MRYLILGLICGGALSATVSALADVSAESVVHVYANILPSITVNVSDVSGAQGLEIATGDFTMSVIYNVSANDDRVELGCVATELHKGAYPLSEHRIPINFDAGCRIITPLSSPIEGGANTAQFTETPDGTLEDFPAFHTNFITFESAQSYRFSMEVQVKVGYSQSSNTQPVGEYGGKIKLIAMITG